VADQPVRRDEPAARRQHSEHVTSERVLVGDVHDRVLREHDVEARVVERQRAGLDPHELEPVVEPVASGSLPRRGEHRVLDVDAGDVGRAVGDHEMTVDPTDPAPDVEHASTRDRCAGHDPVDLVRASWREEPLTPDHLEHADQVVAVQLALVPAHRTPPTPPARVPAGTTLAGVSR
jgi:hypothetical protein